jgi:hypothetical protein
MNTMTATSGSFDPAFIAQIARSAFDPVERMPVEKRCKDARLIAS